MKTILLIDFSALFRSAWHANSNGPISVAYDATIGGVGRAERMTEDCIVAVCCDGKGNWRKALSTEYKAHREVQPENMYEEMRRAETRLRQDGRTVWRVDGFEADDLIATACKLARDRGHQVRIASHDKDMLQLLGPGVDYVNTQKWAVISDRDVLDKYGVEASQFADFLALCGDSSDGVKGAVGIGPQRASALLTRYGTVDGIYSALNSPDRAVQDLTPVGTPGVMKSLEQGQENVYLARKLVSLREDAPIVFDDLFIPQHAKQLISDEIDEDLSREDEMFNRSNDVQPKEESPAAAVVSAGSLEQPQSESKGSVPELPKGEVHGKPDMAGGVKEEGATQTAASDGKELATVEYQESALVQVDYTKQLEPRNFREARIALRIMKDGRLHSKYPNDSAMLSAVVRGREMGYDMGASLDLFHVMKDEYGNLSLLMHAYAIIDRAEKDPNCEYFACLEDDENHAVYETKHKKWPKSRQLIYTIAEATQRGLVRKTSKGHPNGWMSDPRPRLRKTCGVRLARMVYPGATMGLYCQEEFDSDD